MFGHLRIQSLTCARVLFLAVGWLGAATVQPALSRGQEVQPAGNAVVGGHHQRHWHSGGRIGWGQGRWGNSWGNAWGGTSFTVVTPGYFSSFAVGNVGVGPWYPGWGGFNGWSGWGAWGGVVPYRAGWGPGFFATPYVLPPVIIPAGELYGPRALWNQLGVVNDGLIPGLTNPNDVPPANWLSNIDPLAGIAPQPPRGLAPRPPLAAPPVQVARANAPVNPPPAVGVPAQPIKLRKANDAARGRALHLVAVGDEDFRAQKYVEAASRYRRAAQGAPDLAEAHFRQGVTEIALARYESAAKSCKKGLEADPGWIAAGFRLANLYGPNQAAKTAHLERLAQEAAARPGDADLRFLIGVELYLDGEYARARKFFEQAAALHAGDDAHLLAFLRELDRRAPEPRDDAVDL